MSQMVSAVLSVTRAYLHLFCMVVGCTGTHWQEIYVTYWQLINAVY